MREVDVGDCVSFVMGLIVGGIVVGMFVYGSWKAEAIEHGAAQYNPTTGEFEWVTRGTEKGE